MLKDAACTVAHVAQQIIEHEVNRSTTCMVPTAALEKSTYLVICDVKLLNHGCGGCVIELDELEGVGSQ